MLRRLRRAWTSLPRTGFIVANAVNSCQISQPEIEHLFGPVSSVRPENVNCGERRTSPNIRRIGNDVR